MNPTAVFIMPVKISGSEMELRHLLLSVESIKSQTDRDWVLVMINDFSDDKRVFETLDAIQNDLKDKVKNIILNNIEAFENEEDEIDLEALKKL